MLKKSGESLLSNAVLPHKNTMERMREDLIRKTYSFKEMELMAFHRKKLKQARSNAVTLSGQAKTNESAAEKKMLFDVTQIARHLANNDEVKRTMALRLLPGLLSEPLMAESAICVDIVDKATQLFRRFRLGILVQKFQEESMLMKIFQILSSHIKGAIQMASKSYLITEFYKIILFMDQDQDVAATILYNISEQPKSLKMLMSMNKVFESLRKIFHRKTCTIYYPDKLWPHLIHLLQDSPQLGVSINLMEILLRRVEFRIDGYNLENMKCIAIMLSCPKGQEAFDTLKGMKLLYQLISPKTPILDNYEFLLLAMSNAVKNQQLLADCFEFDDLPDILTHLAKRTTNSNEQLYCLQILSSLNTVPEIRKRIEKTCLQHLARIVCLTNKAEHPRLQLICGLTRRRIC